MNEYEKHQKMHDKIKEGKGDQHERIEPNEYEMLVFAYIYCKFYHKVHTNC